MLKYHVTGRWKRGEVELRWSPSTYRSTPEGDAQIDAAWTAAKARLGEKLFDGPMCRLEKWRVVSDEQRDHADPSLLVAHRSLLLDLSLTSYRIFLGTNMAQPDLPTAQRANPVGVSTVLVSSDGFVMMGRRSDQVAYYPKQVHPFAGSLEPGDAAAVPPDLFDNALRELHEELGLTREQVSEIACLGIVEDLQLRHPEAILYARTTLERSEIEKSLLGHEHEAAWNCPLANIAEAAAEYSQCTPVAIAGLTLLAKHLKTCAG